MTAIISNDIMTSLVGLYHTPEGRDLFKFHKEKSTYEHSLKDFIVDAWKVLEPANSFSHNWHIDMMVEYLEAVSAGEITRLIINIPPRHMKSIAVTVCWPCWEWTRTPWRRWIFTSYSGDLALKHSVDRRTLINSEWYQKYWASRFKLKKDQNQKSEFLNDKTGSMVAASVGGRLTGLGGDRIIIDDPINPEKSHSRIEREKAIRYYDQTLHSRLDNPAQGAIVLVMQRLHEEDLTGHLVAKELGFEQVVVPSIAEEETKIVFPRSGREIHRKEGDLIWPSRFPDPVVRATQKALGTYGFSSQYQQKPVPKEGGIFKEQWWRYYSPDLLPVILNVAKEKVIFVDSAFKEKEENDWSVAAAWARVAESGNFPSGFYLLDIWRDQVGFPELVDGVTNIFRKWKANKVVIEDKASGQSLIQYLNRKVHIPAIPWASKDSGDKVVRAHNSSPYIQAGHCWIPDGADFIPDFLSEHRWFPKGSNDDQVDTTTMMVLSWSNSTISVTEESQEYISQMAGLAGVW